MQFSSVFLIAFATVAVSAGELRMVRREKPAKVGIRCPLSSYDQ